MSAFFKGMPHIFDSRVSAGLSRGKTYFVNSEGSSYIRNCLLRLDPGPGGHPGRRRDTPGGLRGRTWPSMEGPAWPSRTGGERCGPWLNVWAGSVKPGLWSVTTVRCCLKGRPRQSWWARFWRPGCWRCGPPSPTSPCSADSDPGPRIRSWKSWAPGSCPVFLPSSTTRRPAATARRRCWEGMTSTMRVCAPAAQRSSNGAFSRPCLRPAPRFPACPTVPGIEGMRGRVPPTSS